MYGADTGAYPTSARVVSLEEVCDWFPVAADTHHDVVIDGTHEVRLPSLYLVSELRHHQTGNNTVYTRKPR